jgi:ParB family transcriptional regulator, chromosome partitioning protein
MSSRLGRGLNQLFKENYNYTEEKQDNESILEIKISELKENPYQPRKIFDEEKIDELAQSIQEHGVFQPIIVKRSQVGYYIVAGERRFRACKKLGLPTIPAIVRDIDDQTMAEIALLENLQRENLSLIEEALAYKMLIDKHSFTQQEVATRVGKSRAHVTNTLRLLSLPEQVQEMIVDNEIEFGHAKILAGLNDANQINALAERVKDESLTVRMLEQVLKEPQMNEVDTIKKVHPKEEKEMDVHLQYLQDELVSKLGTSVKIQAKDQGGKLVIDFNNHADLNRILDIMNLID